MKLYRDFKRVLGERALIRGNFYTQRAMELAAADAVMRFQRSAAEVKPLRGSYTARIIR